MNIMKDVKKLIRANFGLLKPLTGRNIEHKLNASLTLYTSNDVKKRFLNVLENTNIHSVIKFLINKDIIVPTYTERNYFVYLVKKLFKFIGPDYYKLRDIIGFYSPSHNKIFILIENLNIAKKSNPEDIKRVCIHELAHYVARNNPSKFSKMFQKDMNEFFLNFLYYFLQIPDVELKQNMNGLRYLIGTWMRQNFKYSENTNMFLKFYTNYSKNFISFYEKIQKIIINNEEMQIRFLSILYMVNVFFRNGSKGVISEMKQFYIYLHQAMQKAYLKVFKADKVLLTKIFIIQELFYHDEIISVASENRDDIVAKLLSLLKK